VPDLACSGDIKVRFRGFYGGFGGFLSGFLAFLSDFEAI
jgi:hypothetical protein